MPTYEELKSELLEISEVIEKFPEAVKSKVYELLVAQFLGHETPGAHIDPLPKQTAAKAKSKRAPTKKKAAQPKAKKSASKESYSIDRHLNLRGDGSIPSFKEFFDEKSPSGAKQINAVAVYYLKKIIGISEVTLDHVYTCYSEVKKKPPTAFRQSFIDTKNKEGWIEFNEEGYLEIPHRGTVYVEHDLPKGSSD